MSDSGKAVFLSYASQDADAARKIADALRAAGVEVWFDQEALVGGDAWDAKIRGQIASCALFVPVISANTQARGEGYFRLEWKLAVDRSHLMAHDQPFLLPVVIDSTTDAAARVPAEFRAVQWTRLPGGETPNAFGARVKKLLEGEVGARPPSAALDMMRPGAAALPGKSRRWLMPGLITLAAALAAGIWGSGLFNSKPQTQNSKPTAAPLSPARQLVAKAWVLLNKPELARAELDAADSLCRQAAALDPTDADVWAAWSYGETWYCYYWFDNSAQRRESAREKAARAVQLAPTSFEARLAQANWWIRGMAPTQPGWVNSGEPERAVRDLLKEQPSEPRTLYLLGMLLFFQNTANADKSVLERLEKIPGFAAAASKEIAWQHFLAGRFAQADAAADRSIAIQPYWDNLGLKIYLALQWHGDLGLAKATLDRIPLSALQEDANVGLAAKVFRWRREPRELLALLEPIAREWLFAGDFQGPKAFLTGHARLRAGQTEAGRRDLRRAIEMIDKRLVDEPNKPEFLSLKAQALHALGERTEAEKFYRLARELAVPEPDLLLLFENTENALAELETRYGQGADYLTSLWYWNLTAASLRLNPAYDAVRSHPRFAALLARAEADPKKSPRANAGPAPATAGTPAKSVVVLPFKTSGDDKENEYFSDGIAEELIHSLTKIPGLRVIARTSAFSFKGKNLPVAEIAQQLNVAYVIDGSVRKVGTQVRIVAQLVNAATGDSLWSERFSRELRDIFAVQDEIAGEIAKNLELKLAVAVAPKPVNPEAYQHLLHARFFSRREDNEGWRRSIVECKAALAIDPNFAPAAAEMARCYIHLARFSGIGLAEGFKAARPAAELAVALNPELPETQNALAWVQRTADWDWRRADASFRRAYELAPRSAAMIGDYAVMRNNLGHFNEAIALGRRAVELDPLNATTHAYLSLFLGWAGQFEAAVAEIRRGAELNPGAAEWHAYLSRWQVMLGRFDEAAASAEAEPHERYRLFARALVLVGRKDRAAADRLLGELIAKFGDREAAYVAECYAYAGEIDRAFTWLERAYEHRETFLVWILGQRTLDPLHRDPRWPAFVRKMGLAPDQLK